MNNKKFEIFKKAFLSSLLTTTLIYCFYSCKETPTTPELLSFDFGSIQVNSTPTGAEIYLDGNNTGKKTNALLTNVSVGSHIIKLVKEQYQDWEDTTNVSKDATTTVNAVLKVDTVPKLISPEEGAVLDNGRSDLRDVIVWDFDWSDVIGATKYHLYVEHTGSVLPLIDDDKVVYDSSYHYVKSGSYIIDSNRFNWKWKVRAYVNDKWSDWSEERRFDVEPLNTDPPS